MDKDLDEICLPQDTLKILNDFLAEKAEREKKEEESVHTKSTNGVDFEENWQLSQFWYNNDTKQKITSIVKQIINSSNTSIGLLSCPSLYPSVKAVHANTKIFEFDNRFSVHGDDFVFYDFNDDDSNNLNVFNNYFDIIIVDPPFLSEECISKVSKIVKRLSKPNVKIIFCSGEIVEEWLAMHLDLRKCLFKPEHERNLGNEFASYANFNLDELL